MAKKERNIRQYREYFVFRFNDDEPGKTWKIGNLKNFFRHLYIDNLIVRELNPEITSAEDFAQHMSSRINGSLCYALHTHGTNTATFNVVDRHTEQVFKNYYGGTITRYYASSFKGFQ